MREGRNVESQAIHTRPLIFRHPRGAPYQKRASGPDDLRTTAFLLVTAALPERVEERGRGARVHEPNQPGQRRG